MKLIGLKICGLSLIFLLVNSCSKEESSDSAAKKMQEFVSNISSYARSYDPDFIIIPNNGIILGFKDLNPDGELNTEYLSAIDGIFVEALFYNGSFALDENKLSMLQKLKDSEKIMVAEYVTNDNDVADALNRNYNEGFICFTRTHDNFHYLQIPDSVPHSNENDITNLSQAQNFLYLNNSDNFSSKQDMINAISATNFDVVFIDLFFGETTFSASEVNQLKTKANGKKRLVIGYMNIGAAEKFRYYWKENWGLHHPSWIKKPYEGFDDEFWVEFWNKEWQDIIYGNDNSYLKKIIDAGFDGVILDNVEAYHYLYYDE